MTTSTRTKLSLMMLLQYAFNGLWIIPLGTFLDHVGYSGAEVGSIYSTFAIAGISSPFLIGLVADRLFAAQKILGVLNLAGSLVLLLAANYAVDKAGAPLYSTFYWLVLLHFICYMPTWALTNTIALSQVRDSAKEFPGIRLMGTIGWILVSMTTLFGGQINEWFGTSVSFEATNTPMLLSAGIGLIAGVFAFSLPSTPPNNIKKTVTLGDIFGLQALKLFCDRNMFVFAVTSFLIFLPAMFYWAFANLFLNETGVSYAAAWQSTGQMTEVAFLAVMPLCFARFGVKTMLTMGLFAWVLRFACFEIGTTQGIFPMVVLGLVLHGPCFDFFFVTGQLYADHKAPRELRAQVQGLVSMITFGLGWFTGSLFAGEIVQRFEADSKHDWASIWVWPIAIASALLMLFTIFFRDDTDFNQHRIADETKRIEA